MGPGTTFCGLSTTMIMFPQLLPLPKTPRNWLPVAPATVARSSLDPLLCVTGVDVATGAPVLVDG